MEESKQILGILLIIISSMGLIVAGMYSYLCIEMRCGKQKETFIGISFIVIFGLLLTFGISLI